MTSRFLGLSIPSLSSRSSSRLKIFVSQNPTALFFESRYMYSLLFVCCSGLPTSKTTKATGTLNLSKIHPEVLDANGAQLRGDLPCDFVPMEPKSFQRSQSRKLGWDCFCESVVGKVKPRQRCEPRQLGWHYPCDEWVERDRKPRQFCEI
mmetsp:Transcript_3220/g.7158  ORF Transcript_3220/g.7158 Transcript_3220/m.7158 type:complete len:150 (-) Transcript_3220:159-608(-)